MTRRPGRSNLLRRIEELEARSVDGSGLAPHSPAWLAFWQHQFQLYETGQPHALLPLEAVRAIIWATPDEGDEGARAELAAKTARRGGAMRERERTTQLSDDSQGVKR